MEQFLPRGTEKWKLDERFSRANQPRKQTLSNEVDVNLHREILSLLFRLIVSASCGTLVSLGFLAPHSQISARRCTEKGTAPSIPIRIAQKF